MSALNGCGVNALHMFMPQSSRKSATKNARPLLDARINRRQERNLTTCHSHGTPKAPRDRMGKDSVVLAHYHVHQLATTRVGHVSVLWETVEIDIFYLVA